jgi:hypothetical protein
LGTSASKRLREAATPLNKVPGWDDPDVDRDDLEDDDLEDDDLVIEAATFGRESEREKIQASTVLRMAKINAGGGWHHQRLNCD